MKVSFQRIFAIAAIFVIAVSLFAISVKERQAQTPPSLWSSPVQLTPSGSENWYHGFASNGNVLHMAHGDGTLGYRRSTNEGTTWSQEINLGPGITYLEDPLAAEGLNVYLVYFNNSRTITDFIGPRLVGDLFMRKSSDGGLTWAPTVQLTTAQSGYRMSFAVSGPRLDLTWMDYRSGKWWDVYYRRSLDGGATWQPEVLLVAGTNSVGAGRPQVASFGDSVHLAWMDSRDNQPSCTIETGFVLSICTEVYYKRSLDGGATWGPDMRLTNDLPYSGRPDIAVNASSTVFVSYDQMDGSNGTETYLLRSADNGTAWGAPQNISLNTGDSTHSFVAVSGSNVHLAWHDYRTPSNVEVYYATSSDSGATWSAQENISRAAGDSAVPLLALTPNYIHAVWGDSRSGLEQTWYGRRSLDGTPPPVPDTTPPTQPTGLVVLALSGTSAKVSWNPSTDNVGVESYFVYRCKGTNRTPTTQVATVTGTAYQDNGLPTSSYRHRVCAGDAAGNLSSYSSAVRVTLPGTSSNSTKFVLGGRVRTTANLSVRSWPSTGGLLLGTQGAGSSGTIIGGPYRADNYNWWLVDYDVSPDGWGVEDYLIK